MRTGWERATKIMAVVALAATSALAIGCGPAPGYEPEPRVPVGYTPVGDTSVEQYPEPVSSEELQARVNAQQDPNSAENVQAAPGDIVVGADPTQYSDTDPSALTEFKPALDGHGQWVDDSTYGTVWVPSEAEVGTDFVPYSTAGHWTYADDTNYVWVSDYSWGWAPFHYGRWAHVGHHGWVWIPGRTYAGAWVDWRYGPGYDYVGWAPLGPSWYWSNGYAVGWGWGYSPYYTYCHRDYLYDPYVGRHSVYGNDPRAREHESHTRPYVAAAPAVAGGGRVAATPTVGPGGGRIAATPTVGPRPSEIGVAPKMVVAPPRDNAGLARAQAFASPVTAVAHGAAPPATSPVRRRIDHDNVIASPSARPSFDNRSPAMNNRVDSIARSPQVQGVQPSGPRPSSAPSAFDNRAATPRAFSSSSNPAATAPSYRPAPSTQAQAMPQYRSTPVPSYRPSPSPGISQSAPSYRAAPSFSQPAQSYHPAPSAPAMRSAPTYSAPHVSAPAPAARPSAPRSTGSVRSGHR
ncbi:MAG: putative prolin-rich transrane protein [Myxococcaceae bacterium]|nr:putative prolin-rich transrane protein [Myxococcaceae bacterium]